MIERPSSSATGDEYLNRLGVEVRTAVFLVDSETFPVADAFAKAHPDVDVHLLAIHGRGEPGQAADGHPNAHDHVCRSMAERVDLLASINRPQLIVDTVSHRRGLKRQAFLQLFAFLVAGGIYVVENIDACHDVKAPDEGVTVLDELLKAVELKAMTPDELSQQPEARRDRARSIDVLEFDGSRAVVAKANNHFYKLREWDATRLLTNRHGSRWGEVLALRPERDVLSAAKLHVHGDGPMPEGDRVITVPELAVRLYHEATCLHRQLTVRGDYLLPDSFRHPHQGLLHHRDLVRTAHLSRLLDERQPTDRRRLEGTFYSLDTELPSHFGHITTDILSRVWGWRVAQHTDPEVRLVLSLRSRRDTEMPSFQRVIFKALGLPVDDVEYVRPGEQVQVERLIAATPELENPHYVDPDLTSVWRELGENLPPATSTDLAEKVFISRRPGGKRDCVNATSVEKLFDRRGFRIVYPEDHPYAEQKAIFAHARIIGGFAGSGMFNMMFSPDARIILLSGDGYTAQNEYLLAAANGNEIHYFWGESEVKGVPGKYVREAFRSNFTIDLRKHRRALRRVMD